MFVAVTALLVPIVHFKMEHSENDQKAISSLAEEHDFLITDRFRELDEHALYKSKKIKMSEMALVRK